MDRLTLIRPDDWHLHLRDGPALADVVAATANVFGRAVVMPNLKPPITAANEALRYRDRILAATPFGTTFQPLMTLYLTDHTTPQMIREAAGAGVVAAKLYPAGATTHSDAGVTDLNSLDATLHAMADAAMPLLVHGEVTDPNVDIFDRESEFLSQVLAPLVRRHPRLKVVVEHMTTEEAVRFVSDAGPQVAGTLTAHHLLYNRNALFEGGLRPHRYCLPVLKRERHRRALVAAATSGDPKFFLGTDSAPHPRRAKESSCGCAGMYTAPHAMGLYAEVFEAHLALHQLETFASLAGPAFYGMPANNDTITLEKIADPVPESMAYSDGEVVPFRAGGTVGWRVAAS